MIDSFIRVEKDNVIITHGQECVDILQDNYEAKKNTDEIWNKSPEMKQVGAIPFIVAELWKSMGIMDNPKELMRALERNPEFKTTAKRLI